VAGVSNVTFLVDDVATATLPGPFDAVVGRLILMHLRDPIAILTRLRGMLRPNGVVAFLEGIMGGAPNSPSQGRKAWRSLNVCVCGRLVACPRTCLWVWTCDACSSMRGSESTHLSAEALIGGGLGWAGFNLIEETLRGLVETWARAGVEGSDHIVVDGLAERIEREVGDEGTVLMQPHVGAWARVSR
jgi:hypothetical protein